MPSFLSHLAAQPLPPRADSTVEIEIPARGIVVRAKMPAAGSIFFSAVGGLLSIRAAREVEGEPDGAEVQRATYAAIVCATVDGVGPIGGPIEPCTIVERLADATPAAQVEAMSAAGDVPALWLWQIFDGASARLAGDRIYSHAGEGRIIPPFLSPAEASPPSPGSEEPSAPTH